MSAPVSTFHHYLSPAFVKALDELVEDRERGRWWRDVLSRKDLKIAVRNDKLDVYHSGAAIFRIALQDNRVVPRTHFKYLVRQKQAYASIDADGKTFIREAGAELWPAYAGPATLKEMIDAAKPLSGREKIGLHPLILYPKVIDLEVAFWSSTESGSAPPLPAFDDADADLDQTEVAAKGIKHRHDRLDAATLEERDGELWIVFHEAKHFTNPDLRAGPSKEPRVIDQIKRYRKLIEQRESDIAHTYGNVSRALSHLNNMRAKAGVSATEHWDGLIQRAADGATLHVDIEPRLIVFGFDNDQKEGAWKRERQRLEMEGLTVYAVGDPKTENAPAAFRRQKKKPSHAPSANNDL